MKEYRMNTTGMTAQEIAAAHLRFAQEDAKAGNGEQDAFGTGATRSSDADKVDYEGHIHPEVLAVYSEYMHRHRVQRDGQIRGSDNWQEGIPIHRYVKSLLRHTFEFWRMWRGKEVVNPDSGQRFTFNDVLCAVLFNVMGLLYELATRQRYQRLADATQLSPDDRKALEAPPTTKIGLMKTIMRNTLDSADSGIYPVPALCNGVEKHTHQMCRNVCGPEGKCVID